MQTEFSVGDRHPCVLAEKSLQINHLALFGYSLRSKDTGRTPLTDGW